MLGTTVGSPPGISVASPTPDQRRAEGVALQLTTTVTDADGDPAALTVAWSSDQDGALAEAPAGPRASRSESSAPRPHETPR